MRSSNVWMRRYARRSDEQFEHSSDGHKGLHCLQTRVVVSSLSTMDTSVPSIAVAGSFKAHADPEKVKMLAREVGKVLAEHKAMLVLGIENNPGHLPELVNDGYADAGGLALGIFRSREDLLACPYRNIRPVVTAMGRGAGWEAVIVLSSQALILIGGGAGTVQEAAIAYQAGIPIVALQGTGGWADKLAGEYLDHRKRVRIHAAKTPSEAVSLAIQLAGSKQQIQ